MAFTMPTQPEFLVLAAPESSPFAVSHGGIPLGNIFTSRHGSFAYVHDMETWVRLFPDLPHLALKESHMGFVESDLLMMSLDDSSMTREFDLRESDQPLLAGYLGDGMFPSDAGGQGTYRHICDEWNALVQSNGVEGHGPRVYAFGYVRRLDVAHPAIVMDWVGDEGEVPLYRYLSCSAEAYGMGLDARSVARVAFSICEALKPLHRRHICHRDLKPDNVLVSPNGTSTSIVDLGQAWSTNDNYVDSHLTVSPEYGAPELFASADEELFSYRAKEWCDVWSLGAILWYLRVGRDPNAPAHPKDKQGLSLPTELINDIHDLNLSSVINWCTIRSPRTRPTVSAVAIMLSLIESGKAPDAVAITT